MADPKASAPAEGVRTKDGKPVMHVKVYSPFQTYFDDDAYSITGANQTGPFDVLPMHHNFMTLLIPCDLLIQAPDGEKQIKITRGIMHVKTDKVVVFLDV